MGNSTVREKPGKPYPEFPLYAHASGRWAKKIAGRTHFFGQWDDWKAALNRYQEDRDDIHAGRPRKSQRRQSDAPTLAELVNLYVDDCRSRVVDGAMAQRSLDGIIDTLKRLATIRSKHESPVHWMPTDFAEIKEAYFKPIKRESTIRGGVKGRSVARRSQVTVDGDLRRVKAFLNWCADSELTPPPRFGRSFREMSAKQKRLKRVEMGRRDLAAADLQAIIAEASVWFRPLVLLAINGGYGATDLASLAIGDYCGEWLEDARRKTGVERKVWLWPETRAAIDAYLAKRGGKPDTDAPLFLTKARLPWMRGTHDAVGKAFQKARTDAGLSRGTFYDLRRTFQTIGEQSLDFPAVSHVMGHAAGSSDMSATYRQDISRERVQRVCECVRGWLYGR